MSEQEEA